MIPAPVNVLITRSCSPLFLNFFLFLCITAWYLPGIPLFTKTRTWARFACFMCICLGPIYRDIKDIMCRVIRYLIKLEHRASTLTRYSFGILIQTTGAQGSGSGSGSGSGCPASTWLRLSASHHTRFAPCKHLSNYAVSRGSKSQVLLKQCSYPARTVLARYSNLMAHARFSKQYSSSQFARWIRYFACSLGVVEYLIHDYWTNIFNGKWYRLLVTVDSLHTCLY